MAKRGGATIEVRTSKTPPSTTVLRRRSTLEKAGLSHPDIVDFLEKTTGRKPSRQAITAVIGRELRSSEGWIEKGIVRAARAALMQQGKAGEAKVITPAYLGWEDLTLEEDTNGHPT